MPRANAPSREFDVETGKITANATVAVNVGGTPLIRDTIPTTLTIPSGYTPDSGPAVKTYVDATIDIAGDDSNRVSDPHLFTVTVKKDIGDGNGFVAASGQVATVTLAPTFGATPVVDDSTRHRLDLRRRHQRQRSMRGEVHLGHDWRGHRYRRGHRQLRRAELRHHVG